LDKEGQRQPQDVEISRSRKYKIRWRLEGKCTNCGGERAANRMMCDRCLVNARNRRVDYSAKPDAKTHKALYHQRKSLGLCVHCGLNPHNITSLLCDICNLDEWRRRVRTKYDVIRKYGGKCSCPGCEETNFMFLSLDHIHGGGTAERKTTRILGGRLYKYLKNRPVDPKYQVLCFNCNFGKGNRSKCPHELIDQVRQALEWQPKLKVRRNRTRIDFDGKKD